MATIREEIERIVTAKRNIINILKEKNCDVLDSTKLDKLSEWISKFDEYNQYKNINLSENTSYIELNNGCEFYLGSFDNDCTFDVRMALTSINQNMDIWNLKDVNGNKLRGDNISYNSYYGKGIGHYYYNGSSNNYCYSGNWSSPYTVNGKTHNWRSTVGSSNVILYDNNVQTLNQTVTTISAVGRLWIGNYVNGYKQQICYMKVYDRYGNLIAHYIPWLENGVYYIVDKVNGIRYSPSKGTATGKIELL